jgi:hypothetical protein
MNLRAFDLSSNVAYLQWRQTKLDRAARSVNELVVDVADPFAVTPTERHALLTRCADNNMAIYRTPVLDADTALPRQLAAQLGLQQLDANWLADEDGISPIAVAHTGADRAGFIPYTNRPIKWHTDGYYHPIERNIRAMVLHCVRPADKGGVNGLMDHELAYIALRDTDPRWISALMANDAMTIPARVDDEGVARAAQSGPVFSVDPLTGELHMRYTARTRSIVWKADGATQEATAFLLDMLDGTGTPGVWHATLAPGMGLVCNNILHDRSGFDDDPAKPRLLYRARYVDRIASAQPM